jgi:hypothetical protein
MLLLLLVLAGLLIAGTIYGFVRSPDKEPLFRLGENAVGGSAVGDSAVGGSAVGDNAVGDSTVGDSAAIFTGIGRLRIPLTRGAGGSATLILSIAFPYPPHDQPFTEELAAKIGDFRVMAADYFSSLSPEKLVNLDEDGAKTDILRLYNTSLRLGKIETLYFSELMIIE